MFNKKDPKKELTKDLSKLLKEEGTNTMNKLQ